MKRIGFFAVVLMVAAVGLCHAETIRGSGKAVELDRPVSDFSQIHVRGSGDMIITQGDTESLVIRCDDNIAEYIQAEVVGGILKLGPRNVSIRPSTGIEYRVVVKQLNNLSISGSLDAVCRNLETADLKIAVSGSGDVSLTGIDTGRLSCAVSGSGDISVTGSVSSLDVAISGSGDFDAGAVQVQAADVAISGSGSAKVWVEKTLDAAITGSGRVSYKGEPYVDSAVLGSGKVVRVD